MGGRLLPSFFAQGQRLKSRQMYSKTVSSQKFGKSTEALFIGALAVGRVYILDQLYHELMVFCTTVQFQRGTIDSRRHPLHLSPKGADFLAQTFYRIFDLCLLSFDRNELGVRYSVIVLAHELIHSQNSFPR